MGVGRWWEDSPGGGDGVADIVSPGGTAKAAKKATGQGGNGDRLKEEGEGGVRKGVAIVVGLEEKGEGGVKESVSIVVEGGICKGVMLKVGITNEGGRTRSNGSLSSKTSMLDS